MTIIQKNKVKDTRQLEAGFPYILPCSEYVCVEVCQLLYKLTNKIQVRWECQKPPFLNLMLKYNFVKFLDMIR